MVASGVRQPPRMGCAPSLDAASGREVDSALLTAAWRGDAAGVKSALSQGASIESKCKARRAPGRMRAAPRLTLTPAVARPRGAQDGRTPLTWAASRARGAPCVRLLLESGADVNAADPARAGRSVAATRARRTSRRRDVWPADAANPTQSGWTPLHVAHASVAPILLEVKPNLELRDKVRAPRASPCLTCALTCCARASQAGATPLAYACALGDVPLAALLAKQGANVDPVDNVRAPGATACR